MSTEPRRKSRVRRVLEIGFSLTLVVVIFAFVLPRYFDADYRAVAEELRQLSALAVVGLFCLWFVCLFTIFAFLAQTMPGLTKPQAGVLNLSGSAIANVVPFGGAAGIGVTYAQALSWGFGAPAITLSIIVSGVWDVFAKLVFPVVALVALALAGQSAAGLDVAGYGGLAVVAVAIVAFALVMRSEPIAIRVSTGAEAVLNRGRRLFRRPPTHSFETAMLDFRERTVELVRERWARFTFWILAYKVTSFLLELACVRAIGIGGDELSWVQVLAAYALGEVLTTVPLTPSGVGVVEAGNASVLIAFGAPPDAAVAAVLLFRAFDYLFEIPLGAMAWIVWATNRRWRKPAATRELESEWRDSIR